MLHFNSEQNWHESKSGNQHLLLCKHFSFGRNKGFLRKKKKTHKNILHFTTIVLSTTQKKIIEMGMTHVLGYHKNTC